MNRDDLIFGLPNKLKFATWDSFVEKIVWLLYPGAAIFAISAIYSGILYITAGADATKAATAKKNLMWNITGMIIVMLSLAILVWIPAALNGKLGD